MLKGMNTTPYARCAAAGLFLLGLVGCYDDGPAPNKATANQAASKEGPPAKKVEVGKNVFLEIRGSKRRVLVNAYVVQRQARLEQLLCKKMTKEHEAILAADMDARHIHAALLAAGAEAGSPVQYEIPDERPYKPARGTRIKVSVQYQDKDQTVTLPAQQWVRHVKTKKDLEYEWVFAGSRFTPHPEDPKAPPDYAANIGDVICVSNFDTAMLDLPVASTKSDEDLEYEANTERIPALNTPVTIILEPVVSPKKK
jgi:hypothetical protein